MLEHCLFFKSSYDILKLSANCLLTRRITKFSQYGNKSMELKKMFMDMDIAWLNAAQLVFKVKTTAGKRSLRSREAAHFELWIAVASLTRSSFDNYSDILMVEIVNWQSWSLLFTPHKGVNPPAKLVECQSDLKLTLT